MLYCLVQLSEFSSLLALLPERFNPIGGVSCMTPFFKIFLILSVTLLGAINVADAFILNGEKESVPLNYMTQ